MTEHKPVDWTKPITTRDGRKVAELRIEPGRPFPVRAFVDNEAFWWSICGRVWPGNDGLHPLDLVNPPEKRVAWVNVYVDARSVHIWPTKEEADEAALYVRHRRIACVRVEYTDGEGL